MSSNDCRSERPAVPALAAAERATLKEQGWLMLREPISAELLDALRDAVDKQFEVEGDAAGAEFKQEPGSGRLANLINKGEIFQRVVSYLPMLAAIETVLGAQFKLSSLNARTAYPHNRTRQPLHCDMGALPDDRGYWVCNAIWMLDDFTAENGATRFVPSTYRSGRLPQDDLDTPADSHPEEELLIGKAGQIAVMNAHLWHGGMENQTDSPRRALHAFFARRDKPQQQYQKQLIDKTRQDQLSPQLRWLLALDDEENDRVSSLDVPRSGFLK